MATTLHLKGSLFDEELIGSLTVPALPEVGDVVELDGKSFTITDLIREDGSAPLAGEADVVAFAIVEPLAISQRRGARAVKQPDTQ